MVRMTVQRYIAMLLAIAAVCIIVALARYLHRRGIVRDHPFMEAHDPLVQAISRVRANNAPTTAPFDAAMDRVRDDLRTFRRLYDDSFLYASGGQRDEATCLPMAPARGLVDELARLKARMATGLGDARFFAGNGDVTAIDSLGVFIHRVTAAHIRELATRAGLDGYAPFPLDDALMGDYLPANISSDAI